VLQDWFRKPHPTERRIVMFRTIIWATDGSEAADRASATAVELTGDHGKFIVLHADEHMGGRAGGFSRFANEDEIQNDLASKADKLRAAVPAATGTT
jgi:nucleotide-binding universal stress UspA family protein